MLRKALRARYSFTLCPPKGRPLIFDAVGSQALVKELDLTDYTILHSRNESFDVFLILKSIYIKAFSRLRSFRQKPSRFSQIYAWCFVRKYQPSCLLTFTDNNPNFYWLAHEFPHIPSAFIQNGIRGKSDEIFDTTPPTILQEVTKIFVFGSAIGALYNQYLKTKFIPIGSLRNNAHPVRTKKRKDLVTFISQWHVLAPRVGGLEVSHELFFKKAEEAFLRDALQFCRSQGLKFRILQRYQKGSDEFEGEKHYYEQILGPLTRTSEWSFLSDDQDLLLSFEFTSPPTSYDWIDLSTLALSTDSTLGYEAIARGTKTVLNPCRGKLLRIEGRDFGWPLRYPEDGFFWSNRPDCSLKEILTRVYECTDEAWKDSLTAISYEKIMAYDPGNSLLKAAFLSGNDNPLREL